MINQGSSMLPSRRPKIVVWPRGNRAQKIGVNRMKKS